MFSVSSVSKLPVMISYKRTSWSFLDETERCLLGTPHSLLRENGFYWQAITVHKSD